MYTYKCATRYSKHMSVSKYVAQFVEDIEENIYKNELIYRSLLVTKTENESMFLKCHLEKKDYSVISIVEDIISTPDYNTINERIVILTFDKFKQFVLQLHKSTEGLQTYNFIGLSYMLEEGDVNKLKTFYIDITDNNSNDTIILDKDYLSLLYLKNIVT